MNGHHEVTSGELAVLASGRGDGGLIRKLAAGQFSKRLMHLRLLLDASDCLPAGLAKNLSASYELAVAAQEHDPDAVATVLTYPAVGGCLASCLHALRANAGQLADMQAGIGYMGGVAAAAAPSPP